MHSRKKIAAAGLLSGLALTCAGIVQAYGDTDTKDECTRDDRGNVSCVHVQKSETVYESEDGTTHVHQSQNCSTTSRAYVEEPQRADGQPQVTRTGPKVGCSNTQSLPEGFHAPHVTER